MKRRNEENMTAIIDYDAGNLRSVEKALLALGEKAVVSAYEFMKKDAKFDRATANEFGVYCIDGELSSEDIMK